MKFVFYFLVRHRYVGCLIVCCGMFVADEPGRAHDKLLDVWRWLDKLDDANEPFYLTVMDGLKHIVMSSLCHVLYATNRAQCQHVSPYRKFFTISYDFFHKRS